MFVFSCESFDFFFCNENTFTYCRHTRVGFTYKFSNLSNFYQHFSHTNEFTKSILRLCTLRIFNHTIVVGKNWLNFAEFMHALLFFLDYGDVTYNINLDENALAGKEIAISLPAADSRGGSYHEASLWTGQDPDRDGPHSSTGQDPDRDGPHSSTQADEATSRDEFTADALSQEELKLPENREVAEREGRTLYESISYPSHILSVGTEEMNTWEREETEPEDQEKDPSQEEKEVLNSLTKVSEKQISDDGSENSDRSGVGDTKSEDIQNDYNEYGARGGGIPNQMIHLGYDKGDNRGSAGVSGTVYQLVGAGGLTTEDGSNHPRLNQVIPTRTGYAVHTKPGFDTNDPLPVNLHRYSTSHSAGKIVGSHFSPNVQKRRGGHTLPPVQNAPPRYSYPSRKKKYSRGRPRYRSTGGSYSNSPSHTSEYSPSYPTYSGTTSSKSSSGYGYPSDSSSSYKSPKDYAPSSGTNYPPSVYSSVSGSSNTHPGSGTYSDSFASYKPSNSYSNSPPYSRNPPTSYSSSGSPSYTSSSYPPTSYSSSGSPSYTSSSYPESKSYDGSHQTSSSHGSYPSSSSSYPSSYHSSFKSYPKTFGSPNTHDSVSNSYPTGSSSYSFGSGSFPSSAGSHGAARSTHHAPSTRYSNPSTSSLYSSQSQYSPSYSSRSGYNIDGDSHQSHSTSYQEPRTSYSQSYSSGPGHSYSKDRATNHNAPQQYYNSYSKQQPHSEQTYSSYKTPGSGFSSQGGYSNSEPTRYYDASVRVGNEENTVAKHNQSENKDKIIEEEKDTSADDTPGRTKQAVADELQALDDPGWHRQFDFLGFGHLVVDME